MCFTPLWFKFLKSVLHNKENIILLSSEFTRSSNLIFYIFFEKKNQIYSLFHSCFCFLKLFSAIKSKETRIIRTIMRICLIAVFLFFFKNTKNIENNKFK